MAPDLAFSLLINDGAAAGWAVSLGASVWALAMDARARLADEAMVAFNASRRLGCLCCIDIRFLCRR